MNTPEPQQPPPQPDKSSRLRNFLTYRGASTERFGSDVGAIPKAVDALVLVVLSVSLVRNTLIAPHPIAWLIGSFALAYTLLLLKNPDNGNSIRVMLLAAAALTMAIAMPLRTGDHVLVTAYVACLGAMALFFVRGTLAAAVMSVIYIVFVALALSLDTTSDYAISYIVSAVVSLAGIIATALLLLHHFMIRLEMTNKRLVNTAAALQQSLDSLQYSAVAGGVGLWDYDPKTDRWHVNEVFRELTDLPHSQYPILKSPDVMQRLPEEAREQILARIKGEDDQDVEQLEVLKADGSRILCQGMSRFYALPGNKPIRHGMLVRVRTAG